LTSCLRIYKILKWTRKSSDQIYIQKRST